LRCPCSFQDGEAPSLNQQSDESLSDTGFIDQHQDNKLAKTVPLMDFSKSLHGVFSTPTVVPLCLDKRTRVQRLGWKKDGTPDFGEPVPDGPLP
ncbi:MAG: hypothetical protein ACYS0H_08530, partial [Planctomycetota bacterium]|jgi:hypothetical protein